MVEYYRKRVLVTGSTGFVGSNIVKLLREYQYKIRCIVREDSPRLRRIRHCNPEFVYGNIWDDSTLSARMFEEVDVVIHLVGIIQEYKDNTFDRAHVEGTRNMVRFAKEAGVGRFIHMSALGTREGGESMYHQTKWLAEEIVRSSGLSYTIFRPSIIFGGPPCEFIDQMLELINKPLFTPVAGSGGNMMQPVSVNDVAKLFVGSIDNGRSFNRVFEVGGYRKMQFNEIMDVMTEAYKGKLKWKFHIPLWAMYMVAFFMQNILSRPPLTTDQLKMLKEDNTCDIGSVVECFNTEFRDFEGWCNKTLPSWYENVEDEEKVITP